MDKTNLTIKQIRIPSPKIQQQASEKINKKESIDQNNLQNKNKQSLLSVLQDPTTLQIETINTLPSPSPTSPKHENFTSPIGKGKWKTAVNKIQQIQETSSTLAQDDPLKQLISCNTIGQSRKEKEKEQLYQKTIGLFDFAVNIPDNMDKINLDDPTNLRLIFLILKKHKYKRTEKEKLFLKQSLQTLTFFQKFKPLIHECNYDDIFRHLKYQKVLKTKPVFNYGEYSKQCFVVISGQALVAVPNRQADLSQEEKDYLKEKFFMTDEDIEDFEMFYPKFKIVNSIEKGQLFGEIGLYYHQPRTATVFALSDELHLATLDSLAFYNTIRFVIGMEQEKRVTFLKNIPIFHGLKENYLSVILLMHEDVTYCNGNIIYTEGEPAQYIYIVYEGEIELSKLVCDGDDDYYYNSKKEEILNQNNLNDSQIPGEATELQQQQLMELEQYQKNQQQQQKDSSEDSCDLIENQQLLQRRNISIQDVLLQQKSEEYIWLRKQNRNLYIKERKKKKKRIAYSLLGPSSIFGDENMDHQKVKRECQARCVSSQALLFRIKRQSYQDQLRAFCQKVNLIQTLSQRDQFNLSRIQQYHQLSKQMNQQIRESIKQIHQKHFIIDYENIPKEFNPHKTSEKVFNISKMNENLQIQQSKNNGIPLNTSEQLKNPGYWKNRIIRSSSNFRGEKIIQQYPRNLQSQQESKMSHQQQQQQQDNNSIYQQQQHQNSNDNKNLQRCTSLFQFVNSMPTSPNYSQLASSGLYSPYTSTNKIQQQFPDNQYKKSQSVYSQFRTQNNNNNNNIFNNIQTNSQQDYQNGGLNSSNQAHPLSQSNMMLMKQQQQQYEDRDQLIKDRKKIIIQRSNSNKANCNCKLFEDSIIKILYPNKFQNPTAAQRKQVTVKKSRIFSLKAHDKKLKNQEQIVLNSEENNEEKLKQQMFVTYKQLKIDKNFPKTDTAKQTIKYHNMLYDNLEKALNDKKLIAKQKQKEQKDSVQIQINQVQEKVDKQMETEVDWDDIFNFTGIKPKHQEQQQQVALK